MNEVAITRHAERRAHQCGAPPALIDTVLHHADIELLIGDRRIALRLSHEKVAQLRAELGAERAERVASIVLILTDGVLATVLRAAGKPSRRYLRRRR